MTFDRRAALISGLAAAVAPALMGMASRRTQGFTPVASLDALSPLESFTRLRCSPPGETTTWWYSGHVLGRADDNPAVPILSVVGASQSQITLLEDGSVEYRLIEAGYYGEPETGGIVDGDMINRLTGQSIKPKHYLSPQTLKFSADQSITPVGRALPPGVVFNGRMIGPDVKADRLWMGEELFVKVPAIGQRPARVLTSLANFQGGVSDICAGGRFVPASFEYTTWNSFRSWLEMGETKGAMMSRLNSVKLPDWGSLPEDLRMRIQSDHAGAFFDV